MRGMVKTVPVVTTVTRYSTLWIRLLCFYVYPLCYATVLLKFTYYPQYYAQEQELWSDCYVILCIRLQKQLSIERPG